MAQNAHYLTVFDINQLKKSICFLYKTIGWPNLTQFGYQIFSNNFFQSNNSPKLTTHPPTYPYLSLFLSLRKPLKVLLNIQARLWCSIPISSIWFLYNDNLSSGICFSQNLRPNLICNNYQPISSCFHCWLYL